MLAAHPLDDARRQGPEHDRGVWSTWISRAVSPAARAFLCEPERLISHFSVAPARPDPKPTAN